MSPAAPATIAAPSRGPRTLTTTSQVGGQHLEVEGFRADAQVVVIEDEPDDADRGDKNTRERAGDGGHDQLRVGGRPEEWKRERQLQEGADDAGDDEQEQIKA